jgi:hypothetical protein
VCASPAMKRRTVIVEGPLAFRMRRLPAARRLEAGVQIVTLPLLADHLAGDFFVPRDPKNSRLRSGRLWKRVGLLSLKRCVSFLG